MKKWEYKSFQDKLTDTIMNQLGKQGWELVNHTAVATSDFLGGAGQFKQYYVFKRELKEKEDE
jgi:hypothetical protein